MGCGDQVGANLIYIVSVVSLSLCADLQRGAIDLSDDFVLLKAREWTDLL